MNFGLSESLIKSQGDAGKNSPHKEKYMREFEQKYLDNLEKNAQSPTRRMTFGNTMTQLGHADWSSPKKQSSPTGPRTMSYIGPSTESKTSPGRRLNSL